MKRINIAVPLNEFKEHVDRLIRIIKKSLKAEGVNEILIPGEPEYWGRGDKVTEWD